MKQRIQRISKYAFLFEELVKRDFTRKYKRSVLGMGWSVLSPLLTLFVMKLVFTQLLGKNIPHYTIYLFSGNLILSYYKEATRNGMSSFLENSGIITHINVPKYMFVLSRNVSALVNFALTLVVYFLFCATDRIEFRPAMVLLVFPVVCLLLLNIGVGLILSTLFVFFRDVRYLYDVFLTLLTYVSAVFYSIEHFSLHVQRLFLINPVYVYIKYFRVLVIDGKIPSLQYHGLCLFYALSFLLIGIAVFRHHDRKLVYYL